MRHDPYAPIMLSLIFEALHETSPSQPLYAEVVMNETHTLCASNRPSFSFQRAVMPLKFGKNWDSARYA
jgi:hypothetical protein